MATDHTSRLLALVAERTGYPNEMLDLNLNIESDLGIDSIKRLEILIAFAKEIPGAPEDFPEQLNTSKTLGEVLAMVANFSPAPAVATPVPGVPPAKSTPGTGVATDHTSRLLALVAERTGYPTDMLDLNLNIESDLGIDSIKRLEILIAFAKEIPGAPEDLPEQLNVSKTLGEVLEKAALWSRGAPTAPPPMAQPQPRRGEGTAAPDHKTKLLALVAERTGYPTDMLDLNLNIESDLGIDSIKRLEILIAFAKEIPGAPEDFPEQLNVSKTLGEVLEKTALWSRGAPTAPPPMAQPQPRRGEGTAAPDHKTKLLALVAERTGYPTDMLDLNLNIESDLGIDSIKRLEILIAFAKEIPGAPEDLPEQLNTSKTLGEVLEKTALWSRGAPTAPPPMALPQPRRGEGTAAPDHKTKLLALVAERTGYPTDMLDLNLNIESDLGIDSIKRLEILIAFAKEIPGAPEDLPEQLNVSKTLGEVLEKTALWSRGAPTAPPPMAQPQPRGEGTAAPDHKTKLLALVAERTGYPTDMLDLNLNIESDLGIDSIKRLEILIAFAKEIPGAPEDLPEQLNVSKTLGEVLEKTALWSRGAPTAPPPMALPQPRGEGTAAPDHKAKPLAGVYRNLIHLKASPLPEVDASIAPSGVVIVTDDGEGFADAMVKSLKEQGTSTRLIGTTARTGVEVVALHDIKAISAWVDSVRASAGPIGGVMHLLPLRKAPAMDTLKLADWQKLVDEEVKGLFYLLKAVAPDLKKGAGKCVLAATALGKSAKNGSLPQPANPWRGGIMGLMKSVADEWPQAVCKVIDLSGETVAKAIPALLAETAAGLRQKEIYYQAGKRFITETETVALDRAKARMTFSKDDVILIIGGARGITSLIAQEIASRHQPTLILAGRSPWPDATESNLTSGLTDPTAIKKVLFEQAKAAGKSPTPKDLEKTCQRILADRTMRTNRTTMEKAGSRVAYYPVDVTDEAGMTAMIKDVYAKFGRLDGVINGAGIIEDKLIEDKTPESFDRVFDNKVKSVYLLSRLLKPESLKFLVLFSSIAGWFGNRGQSDYAAANEVLNRMAMYLDERWNNRVVAIDWGPWDQLGMASDQVKKQFQERGVGLIDPVAGRDYMLDELMYGERSQAIIVAEGQLI